MKKPKLKGRRFNAQTEVAKMLKEDAVFRENFLSALPISPLLKLLISTALDPEAVKRALARTDSRNSPGAKEEGKGAE